MAAAGVDRAAAACRRPVAISPWCLSRSPPLIFSGSPRESRRCRLPASAQATLRIPDRGRRLPVPRRRCPPDGYENLRQCRAELPSGHDRRLIVHGPQRSPRRCRPRIRNLIQSSPYSVDMHDADRPSHRTTVSQARQPNTLAEVTGMINDQQTGSKRGEL